MRKNTTWSDEALIEAVKQSTSLRQVLLMLNLSPQGGGGYQTIQRRIKELELNTSHLTGKGWSKGKRFPVKDIEKLLVILERPVGSHALKKKLFKAGLKTPKCELCGWCEVSVDGRIPVELDHTNGNKLDNRIQNLRILCPNCHSLQITHRGCNKKSKDKNKKFIAIPIKLEETPGGLSAKIDELLPRVCKEKIERWCEYCHNLIRGNGVKYCDSICKAKSSRLVFLTKDVLEKLIWEKPSTKIASENGVSDSAIKALCRRLGVDKPPPGYWAKVTNGISKEDALKQCRDKSVEKQKVRDSLLKISDDIQQNLDTPAS